jgi:ABC-type polysaccharide/polyol phosphate export permease
MFKKIELIYRLVNRDLFGTYSGSVLGSLWAFIDPIIYVGLTLFFFQFAIKGIDTHGVPYVAWVLPQIIFWTFISGVVNSSVNAVKDYSFLMRHRELDLRIIAIIKLLSGLTIHFLLISLVMIILYSFLGVQLTWRIMLALYYLLAMCVLLIAISLIVSALGVFWKDIRNIVSVIMQVEFWISPIFWTADRFPTPIAVIMYINPFYYPMQGYRQSLLGAEWGPHSLAVSICFWGICLSLLAAASWLFKRLYPRFGDVL